MADQDLGSVLALAEKLSANKELKVLIGDLSTGIGDVVTLLEDGPKKHTEMFAAALSEALASTLPAALAAALSAAVKGLPAPQVTQGPGANWKTMDCDVEVDARGFPVRLSFTRK